MTFNKYSSSNEAIWQLATPISANSTNLILWAWQWDLFPNTFPFKLKLEQFDISWNVTKREIVLCTNKISDNLIVTRWNEACPSDYTATTQTTTQFSFDTWDSVSLAITSETITDIQNEVTRLENDKLNKSTYNAEKIAYASTSTGNDDYAITVPDIIAYTETNTFKIKADVWNTWSATLNINWLWAKTLKKLKNTDFSDLETGDIISTQIFRVTYNSSNWWFFQFDTSPATAIVPNVGSTKSTFIAWESITAWNSLRNGVEFDEVTSHQSWASISYTYVSIWYSTTYYKSWQSFTIESSWRLKSFSCYMTKSGSPTFNIQAFIYDSANNLIWTSTNTILSSTLTTVATYYDFNFTSLNLVPGVYKILVAPINGSVSSTNYVQWQANLTWTYTWGVWLSATNTNIITEMTWSDKNFYFTFTNTTENFNYVYKTNASNSSKINFIWFATNTVSTWWTVTVDTCWINNNQSSLVIWSTYYLSDTAWTISSSAWTNSVKIWKAISSSWILIVPTPL